MHLDNVGRLDAGQMAAVMALDRRAQAVDHVAPLSEQVLLAARDSAGPGTEAGTGHGHFLAYDGTHLAGYAHLERGPAGGTAGTERGLTAGGQVAEGATAEVVVDPADRRHGVGTALIRAMQDALGPRADSLRIWSHGHLDGARALASRDGYSIVRELWSMRRPLLPDDGSLPAVTLPDGFTARHFIVGQDEETWLRVNARAFADHAEQGRLTRHDLDLRVAEPWFDATGFILVEDTRAATPVLAASHWTKIVASARPRMRPTQGEVYVVGVDPEYRGLGLGRAVTILGLEHLRERGVTEAMLFVDGDNTAAIATYSRLGFTRFAVDVMYSPAVQPRVPR
jgi:mycothiol synthase